MAGVLSLADFSLRKKYPDSSSRTPRTLLAVCLKTIYPPYLPQYALEDIVKKVANGEGKPSRLKWVEERVSNLVDNPSCHDKRKRKSLR